MRITLAANALTTATRREIFMNPVQLRRLLITLHLYLAGFMAPAFLLVAISGGLHIAAGGVEQKTRTEIALPAEATFDFASPDRDAAVRAFLKEHEIKASFEYTVGRGNKFHTRPTSRTSLEFEQADDGLKVTKVKPNLAAALMELHKGHGPKIFRTYQILVGLALLFAVLGGVLVGLLAPAYRKTTMIATGAGTVIFLIAGFML